GGTTYHRNTSGVLLREYALHRQLTERPVQQEEHQQSAADGGQQIAAQGRDGDRRQPGEQPGVGRAQQRERTVRRAMASSAARHTIGTQAAYCFASTPYTGN